MFDLRPYNRKNNVTSYNPFREMDSFFDDFFTLKPSTLFASEWAPSVDVAEDDRTIHVKADMPGMSDKDKDIKPGDQIEGYRIDQVARTE